MWGMYLDSERFNGFQTVIRYDNEKSEMLAPERGAIDLKRVKPLPNPPEFEYNARVSPVNHPELTGRIAKIYWHFDKQSYYYIIEINGKLKSKRYFAEDLASVE